MTHKTVKKKLYKGAVIEVDAQILRWRELRKKNPDLVGKAAKAMQKKDDRSNALAATLAEITAKTKKYF